MASNAVTPAINKYVAVKTISSSQSILASDGMVFVQTTGGPVVVTLPTCVNNIGLNFDIKKISSDGNSLTVSGVSNQTIDGGVTQVINSPYTSLSIVSDGSNWWVR